VQVFVTGNDLASAEAAEAAFHSGQIVTILEDFEDETDDTRASSFATGVGTFETASNTKESKDGTRVNGGLGILSATSTPFNGRFDITTGSGQWLDTFDADITTLTLSGLPGNATGLGFFLTDLNDQGGRLDLDIFDSSDNQLFDGTNILGGSRGNGTVQFIEIAFHDNDVAKLVFTANDSDNADGFGFDDFSTVAPIPLPAAGWMLLAGAGALFGIGRKRQSV
jgi:hypothetical protein